MTAIVSRQLTLLTRLSRYTDAPSASTVQLHLPQTQAAQEDLQLLGKSYSTDDWTNVSAPIVDDSLPKITPTISRIPSAILRSIIEARFPIEKYTRYNDLPPIVTVKQNFDSLGIPLDHPGQKSNRYILRQCKDSIENTYIRPSSRDIPFLSDSGISHQCRCLSSGLN